PLPLFEGALPASERRREVKPEVRGVFSRAREGFATKPVPHKPRQRFSRAREGFAGNYVVTTA
ncbi:hypothetical protein, partial [Solidesulfovibrio alcoholivorans]|uniref:hypothetical protein n=1 Tax=Solidesulfovibrio alcoholivorans TaxID=81406 RepID=UPI001B80C4E7